MLEAIILAGGAGTRLKGHLPDIPKPMADVAGRPFLDYVLGYAARHGVGRFILSVSHRREAIKNHLGESFGGIPVDYSVEEEPQGTGGAIILALERVRSANALVLNGDTLFELDLGALMAAHEKSGCDVTLGLKHLPDCGRYGAVAVEEGRIAGFKEKGRHTPGLINGGVYAVGRDLARRFGLKGRFSFEADFMQARIGELALCPFVGDGYFIDIGVPEDLEKARMDMNGD